MNKPIQNIINTPHPIIVKAEEEAIFNLSLIFDLLLFNGLSKIRDITKK